MTDPAKYDQTETLKSGQKVRIRAIHPDDKGRILDAFRHLEPESIYTRFFQNKKTLTDAALTHLCFFGACSAKLYVAGMPISTERP